MANIVGTQTSRAVAGPLAFGPDSGDSFFVALLAERGPSDVPQVITSFSRLEAIFGGATPFASETKYSTGYEVLKAFYSKGGKKVVALRIVGSSAVEAYVDIADRAGTPVDTLRVYGKGEGTWANSYYAKVEDGTKSDTFKLSLYDDNPATSGELVDGEEYDNLKMTSAYITAVNNQSDWIRLEDLDSATAAPDNRPANGNYQLNTDQAGVDDNAPSASDIVGTDSAGVKTGLKAFRLASYGRGFVGAPDLDDDSTVRTELINQAEAYYRVPMFSSKADATPATAKSDKGTAEAFNAVYYFPRALVEDAETEELKAIPVIGHVAADWIRAIERDGPGKVPAGRDFKINYVAGIETQSNGQPLVDGADGVGADLVGSGVNPIYDRDGNGPKVWGGRTTSDDASWQYPHAGYLWCRIGHAVQEVLDDLTYDVVDNQDDDSLFLSQIERGVYQYMASLWDLGAFNGRIPMPTEEYDPDVHAFNVICDLDLLSDSDKNNGITRCEVEFKPALTNETMKVKIAKRNN